MLTNFRDILQSLHSRVAAIKAMHDLTNTINLLSLQTAKTVFTVNILVHGINTIWHLPTFSKFNLHMLLSPM
jgi:succinate dehydrogenase/fumarate reductase cytochrome b subunit